MAIIRSFMNIVQRNTVSTKTTSQNVSEAQKKPTEKPTSPHRELMLHDLEVHNLTLQQYTDHLKDVNQKEDQAQKQQNTSPFLKGVTVIQKEGKVKIVDTNDKKTRINTFTKEEFNQLLTTCETLTKELKTTDISLSSLIKLTQKHPNIIKNSIENAVKTGVEATLTVGGAVASEIIFFPALGPAGGAVGGAAGWGVARLLNSLVHGLATGYRAVERFVKKTQFNIAVLNTTEGDNTSSFSKLFRAAKAKDVRPTIDKKRQYVSLAKEGFKMITTPIKRIGSQFKNWVTGK